MVWPRLQSEDELLAKIKAEGRKAGIEVIKSSEKSDAPKSSYCNLTDSNRGNDDTPGPPGDLFSGVPNIQTNPDADGYLTNKMGI